MFMESAIFMSQACWLHGFSLFFSPFFELKLSLTCPVTKALIEDKLVYWYFTAVSTVRRTLYIYFFVYFDLLTLNSEPKEKKKSPSTFVKSTHFPRNHDWLVYLYNDIACFLFFCISNRFYAVKYYSSRLNVKDLSHHLTARSAELTLAQFSTTLMYLKSASVWHVWMP